MSSGSTSARWKLAFAPALTASLKLTWPGSDHAGTIFFTRRTTRLTSRPFRPSRSPIEPTTTCLTEVLATTFSSVEAKFSRMTIASAPESLSWCSSSRGV